jgi:SP family general alpha glucoside:H+ symporter-like MFS transporter
MTPDPEPVHVTGVAPVQDPADHSHDDIAAIKRDAVTLANAKKATENEHNMSVWDCVKLYPKAIGWSVVISTCTVMEAYDVSLLSNFYAFAQFNEKYGRQLPDGSY